MTWPLSIPVVPYSLCSHYKFTFINICGPHIDVNEFHPIFKSTLMWHKINKGSRENFS